MPVPTKPPIEKLFLPRLGNYAVFLRLVEYTFILKNNETHNFLSFDLYDTNENHIVSSKISYGYNLVPDNIGTVFAGYIGNTIPEINIETFNRDVFLYIYE